MDSETKSEMRELMKLRDYHDSGIAVGDVLLPREGVDLTKWAVVACDQYTSEPEYWEEVRRFVGDAPSTLNLIYPEVYLGEDQPEKRIAAIRAKMDEYVDSGILVPHSGVIYLQRRIGDKTRSGLVLCLDLERYDYRQGSTSLIRATEGTIVERLPPRVKIRRGARLELPHIMVLIDDPADSVMGPLRDGKQEPMTEIYDFDLMMGAGHLRAWRLAAGQLEQSLSGSLGELADPPQFAKKYGFDDDRPVLLYAMGDGNHSLATAKSIWEDLKAEAGGSAEVMQSAKRFALVEVVNLHDDALQFEPIHRVIFKIAQDRDLLAELQAHYQDRFSQHQLGTLAELTAEVNVSGVTHRIGVVKADGYAVAEVADPDANLAVGTLQSFLDGFIKSGGAEDIDYVHGTEPLTNLGAKPGNMGFYLPPMDKHELFKSVILDGALPRKTFSMGEAYEKRFYVECRELS